MRTTRDHAEIPELMEVLGLVEVEEGADGDGVMRTNAPRLKADEKRWDKALKSRKGTGSSMAARMSRMSLDVARSISGSLGGVGGSGGVVGGDGLDLDGDVLQLGQVELGADVDLDLDLESRSVSSSSSSSPWPRLPSSAPSFTLRAWAKNKRASR